MWKKQMAYSFLEPTIFFYALDLNVPGAQPTRKISFFKTQLRCRSCLVPVCAEAAARRAARERADGLTAPAPRLRRARGCGRAGLFHGPQPRFCDTYNRNSHGATYFRGLLWRLEETKEGLHSVQGRHRASAERAAATTTPRSALSATVRVCARASPLWDCEPLAAPDCLSIFFTFRSKPSAYYRVGAVMTEGCKGRRWEDGVRKALKLGFGSVLCLPRGPDVGLGGCKHSPCQV